MDKVLKILLEQFGSSLQLPDITFEIIANRQNTIVRMMNVMILIFMKVKNRGRPGPKKDS